MTWRLEILALFRPEMVLGWEKGQENHWQATLWREMGKAIEKKHQAALKGIFLEGIKCKRMGSGLGKYLIWQGE